MNVLAAKLARESGTLVILDVGGRDEPLSDELLRYVDILSPNEVSFDEKIFIFYSRPSLKE